MVKYTFTDSGRKINCGYNVPQTAARFILLYFPSAKNSIDEVQYWGHLEIADYKKQSRELPYKLYQKKTTRQEEDEIAGPIVRLLQRLTDRCLLN